mmetsp:Transcript_134491/g.268428  ORF Transcript_134491/g.268428 Transcript_134491/m.268428 type:complete len:105 (+) Transcript_134491:1932-2246(+)
MRARSSCETMSRGIDSKRRSRIQKISWHTECKKPTSWDTTTVVWGYSSSLSSSQRNASKSRWFVGSSSNRIFGLSHSAFASCTFMRQPPERCCIDVPVVGRVFE